MEEISFLVQGSAEEPYRVTFRKNGNTLNAYCTSFKGTIMKISIKAKSSSGDPYTRLIFLDREQKLLFSVIARLGNFINYVSIKQS